MTAPAKNYYAITSFLRLGRQHISRWVFVLATVFLSVIAANGNTVNGQKTVGNPSTTYRWPADAVALVKVNTSSQSSTATIDLENWSPDINIPASGYPGYDPHLQQGGIVMGQQLSKTLSDTPLDVGITRYELWIQRDDPKTGINWYFDKYIIVDTQGNIVGIMDLRSGDLSNQYRALSGSSYLTTATEEAAIGRVYEGAVTDPTTLTIPPHYLQIGKVDLNETFMPETWTSTNYSQSFVAINSAATPQGRYDEWQLRIGTNMYSAPEVAMMPGVKSGEFKVSRPEQVFPVGKTIIDDKKMNIFDAGQISLSAPSGVFTNVPNKNIVSSVANLYPQSAAVITIEASTGNSGWFTIYNRSIVNGTSNSLTPISSALATVNAKDVAIGDAQYRIRIFLALPYNNDANLAAGVGAEFSPLPGQGGAMAALTHNDVPATIPSWPVTTWLEYNTGGAGFSVAPANITIGQPGGTPGGPGEAASRAPAATITTEK